MQQLTLSGFRVADGSDIRADPTNGEILSLLTAPRFDIAEPSPFVKTATTTSTPTPTASSSRRPRKATEEPAPAGAGANSSSGMAPPPFAGRDGWADQLNALARDFVPTRFPSGPAAPSAMAAPSQTANPLPTANELGVGPTPTPTTGTDGSRELDPTLVSALVVGDLDWFTSLVGMFDSGQAEGMNLNWDMNPPPHDPMPAVAFGAPQPASSAPLFPTSGGALRGWSLGQQELASTLGNNPMPIPIPMEVQSQSPVDPGDPRQWQGQGLPMPQSAL